MKKVVLASLLCLACAAPTLQVCFAQAVAPSTGQGSCSSGQVQMSEAEYAAYNAAMTASTPAAKAAAFEAYLKAYPNSCVKTDVLNQMLFAYNSAGDKANTVGTADRLLAVDPQNLRAITLEVYYGKADADAMTDPAAKTAALDKVAAFAQTGLTATKPKDTAQADFDALKKATTPTFYSAIADDDMSKKDNAGAVTALKAEIAADPDDTTKASPVLQDVFVLSQAYYTMTPPDFLNCAWYATRAVDFAPDAYKPQIQPLATYCYQKYHGSKDGYDALVAMTKTAINPPADIATTVKPAPKPEDYVVQIISTTPDLSVLALSDKEFILQYGKPEDADKVFATIKGKSVEIPDAIVISATDTQLTLAVSDDAIQSKTADFTANMKTPFSETKAPAKVAMPAVGDKVTFQGVYDSYTQKPVMITMTDAELVLPKKAAPAKKTTTTHKPRPAQ